MIATILMVAITVVLAGVLVVYMQQFSGGPSQTAPQGTFVASTFSNPSTVTTNGGGWSVRVTALSGGNPAWSDVTVSIKTDAGVPIKQIKGIENGATGISNVQEASIPYWYLANNGAAQYDEGGASTPVTANEANMAGGEFNSVENAYFIVMDNDGDKKLSINDIVIVYKDNDANSVDDVLSGYSCDFKVSAGGIGGAPL